jgi:hypothetical protein
MSRRTKRGRVRALQNCPANPVAPIFKGTRTILLLRSGVSADRRKYFRLFSDGGALPRRRYANRGRRSRVQLSRAVRFPAGANVAQAFGHDAAGMGEISMPIMVCELLRGWRKSIFVFKNTRPQKLHTVNDNMPQPFRIFQRLVSGFVYHLPEWLCLLV